MKTEKLWQKTGRGSRNQTAFADDDDVISCFDNNCDTGIYVILGGNYMNRVKRFIKDEGGMGVVEVILIIVVLISLVLIFKTQITAVVKSIFIKITNGVAGI